MVNRFRRDQIKLLRIRPVLIGQVHRIPFLGDPSAHIECLHGDKVHEGKCSVLISPHLPLPGLVVLIPPEAGCRWFSGNSERQFTFLADQFIHTVISALKHEPLGFAVCSGREDKWRSLRNSSAGSIQSIMRIKRRDEHTGLFRRDLMYSAFRHLIERSGRLRQLPLDISGCVVERIHLFLFLLQERKRNPFYIRKNAEQSHSHCDRGCRYDQ